MTNYTIHTSREAAQAVATHWPDCKLVEVFKRNPTKYAGVWIPTANIPNTEDVPATYRAIVDSVIAKTIKSIIDVQAFSGNYIPTWIPADKLSADSIIAAMTASATTWLTKEEVAQGWEASATYQGFKAKMLALPTENRKGYSKALDAFSESINKLSAKSVKSITPEQATTMLAKLADADLTTTWGEFIATRLGTIANKEEPEEFDLDSL